MLGEDLLEASLVGRIRAIDLAWNRRPLLFAETLDAPLPHLSGELDGEIQRDEGKPVLPRVVEDRLVEAEVVSPALMVFGPAQKLSLAELARDVVVEMALEGLLEGLHADRQLRMDRVKAADDLELHQMVVEAIVRLADQDDPALGERGNQRLQVRHRAEIQGSRRADRARGPFGLGVPRNGRHRMVSWMRRRGAAGGDRQPEERAQRRAQPGAREPQAKGGSLRGGELPARREAGRAIDLHGSNNLPHPRSSGYPRCESRPKRATSPGIETCESDP
jgi:hypothetical protein